MRTGLEHPDIEDKESKSNTIQETAYEELLNRVRKEELSLTALYSFANRCYHYWQQHLPNHDERLKAEQVVKSCKDQYASIAQGRGIYRQKLEGHCQYYWANDSASHLQGTGTFYICHPFFALEQYGQPTLLLKQITIITDTSLCQTLAQQEEAEQLLDRQIKIREAMYFIAREFKRLAPETEQEIANYQMAYLLFTKGYVNSASFDTCSYMTELFQRQALQQWISGPPIHETKIISATKELREQIESKILYESRNNLLQSLSTSIPLLPSQWQKRDKIFHDWHTHSQRCFTENRPARYIQSENTRIAEQLISHIAQEAELQLGESPYPLVLVGLGSLSRGQTSYASDIEFAIATADPDRRYSQSFLDMVAFKATSFPRGIFALEQKELINMKNGECWIGTPESLLNEHCFLPEVAQTQGIDFARSFPLRWPKCLYLSKNPASELLWKDYQDRLTAFFQQKKHGIPYYRLIEPWTLKKHLQKEQMGETLATVQTSQVSETKHVSLALKTVNLKTVAYPLYNAILCYSRYTGITDCSEIDILITRLITSETPFSKPFLIDLDVAMQDLLAWRLQKHWDLFHHSSLTDLHVDEVWLWPKEVSEQLRLTDKPRGFYLNAKQTERYQIICVTVKEAIYRSVEAFEKFAKLNSIEQKLTINSKTFNPIQAAIDWTQERLITPHSISFQEDLPWLTAITLKPYQQNIQQFLSEPTNKLSLTENKIRYWIQQWQAKHDRQDFIHLLKDLALLDSQSIASASEAIQVLEDHKRITSLVAQEVRIAVSDMKHCSTERLQEIDERILEPFYSLLSNGISHWQPDPLMTTLQHQLGDWANMQAKDPAEFLQTLAYAVATRLAASLTTVTDWMNQHLIYYRQIPRDYREIYIDLLQQKLQSDQPSGLEDLLWKQQINQLISRLSIEPDAEGWRLTKAQQQKFWQKDLMKLFGEETKASTLNFISQIPSYLPTTSISTYHCPPEIQSQLSAPKPPRQLGRRRVIKIKMGQLEFAAKLKPALPGTEYLIAELAWRVSGEAILPSWLMNGRDDAGNSLPIQLFPYLPNTEQNNLEKILRTHPEYLRKLEPTWFSRALLRVLLTHPLNDKGEDYILVPFNDVNSQNHYQLLHINNEQAFFPAEEKGGYFEPNAALVRSIVLCLNQMCESLNSQVIDEFLQLNPAAVLEAWLKDTQARQSIWNQLFDDQEIKTLAEIKDPKTNKPTPSFPVFFLPLGIEGELFNRLTKMQNYLRTHRLQSEQKEQKKIEPSGMELLKAMPEGTLLAEYYDKAFQIAPYEENKPEKALQRFAHIADNKQILQPLSKLDTYQIMTKSLQLAEPLTIRELKWVRTGQRYSYAQALNALLSLQQQQITELQSELPNQKLPAANIFPLLDVQIQTSIFAEFEKKLESSDGAAYSSNQQLFLLSVMHKVKFYKLNLKGFKEVLTESLLKTLLAATGYNLRSLDLSGCTLLGDNSLSLIALHCSNLQNLSLRGLHLKKISSAFKLPIKLTHLSKLDVSNCTFLTEVYIETPIGCQLITTDSTRQTTETITRLENSLGKNPLDSKNAEVQALLQLLEAGEQDESENLIIKERELLLKSGSITTRSGQFFPKITAFQLAVWNLDWRMWTMILRYLPIDKAIDQFLELKEKGVGQPEPHQLHFSLPPLINALQIYADKLGTTWDIDSKEAKDHWCRVIGGKQKELPINIVYEYTNPFQTFDPCPTFTEEKLTRSRKVQFLGPGLNGSGDWFTAPSPHALGSTFAFFRAAPTAGRHYGKGYDGAIGHLPTGTNDCWNKKWIQIDINALKTIWQVRTEKLKSIQSTLPIALIEKAGELIIML